MLIIRMSLPMASSISDAIASCAVRAAAVIGREPAAIQLRYLQTVTEIASEKNSTTIFPIPIDLFRGVLDAVGRRSDSVVLALPARGSREALPAVPAKDKVPA